MRALLFLTLAVLLATAVRGDSLVAAFKGHLCQLSPALCAPTHSHGMPHVARTFFDATILSTAADVAEALDTDLSTLMPQLSSGDADVAKAAMASLRSTAEARGLLAADPGVSASQFPYFGFVPQVHGRAVPGGAPLTFGPTPCGRNFTVSAALDAAFTTATVSIGATKSAFGAFCTDRLYFVVGAHTKHFEVAAEGHHVTKVDLGADTPAQRALQWDASTNGVRVMRDIKNKLARDLDVIDTLLLFLPMITGKLDHRSAVDNADFLSNYTLMKPYTRPRAYKNITVLDPATDIHSGDSFGKMELDGLAPVEALVQGTTSGHVAFALRRESDGVLFVCESIIKGVTCTEYHAWTESLQKIDNGVVLVPLKAALRAKFNVTAAWAWVNKTLGNEYGYHNFFFGLIDTRSDNLPCFPPFPSQRCLAPEHVELVMRTVDNFSPKTADTFFGQALNHRAGTRGLNISEVLFTAGTQQGLDVAGLMKVVEEDAWLYNATRRGVNGTLQIPSQVCSTLGCNTLRAAGVFDGVGEFQCAEMTVWDYFSLDIFDKSRMGAGRPQACIDTDPDNYLCQITGTWVFDLQRDVNTRAPFAHMGNDCATRNPAPYNHTGCYAP